MKGLNFHLQKPITVSAPNRTDVACFVGLVKYRTDASIAAINHWLYEQGWLNSAQGYKATYHRDTAMTYLDIPVPIENWEIFDRLFAWDQRPLSESNEKLTTTSYLGAAVHSFFAQGGRKCYVVRVGDPLPISASKTERELLIEKIIPGFTSGVINAKKVDRKTWHGIGHLFGLPDASFVCMPDLPDLVQTDTLKLVTEVTDIPGPPEQFVECSETLLAEPTDNLVTSIPAPRTDEAGYEIWRNAIHHIATFIAENQREVQLLAAIPLPDNSTLAANSLLSFMHQQSWLSNSLETNESIASAFVQLSYPWLITSGSHALPEQLEPSDGALTGMLARNALNKGTYRSVIPLKQTDISGVFPELSRERLFAKNAKAPEAASPNASLIDRVTLFGIVPDGIGILSDVTTSNLSAHRPANINRIISLIMRATRRAGEEFLFEANGETLWSDIKLRINNLLLNFFNLGALRGKQPEDAFYVRCDRSTMSQNDIDNGIVIAQIHIEPATSIDTIDVTLAMDQSGQILMTSSSNKAVGT